MKELCNEDGLTLSEFLHDYDANNFERPSLTADIALFTLAEYEESFDLSVLLVKRRNHPAIGEYALPGGFVNMDETTLAAAQRELFEETGVEGICLRRFDVFDAIDRDPRTRVVTVGHYGLAPLGTITPKAGDDAADAAFFSIDLALEAASASAETYRITLFGSRILVARAQLRYDTLGSYTADVGGDLASDHSHVLFAALCALSQLPRKRVARLLTLGSPHLEQAAVESLNRLFAPLSDINE